MEANNTCLENVTSGQAVRALTEETRSKLVIQRTNKIPEWKLAKQKTLWYNTRDKTITAEEADEYEMKITTSPDRRVVISASKKNKIIGINIRGGLEYGLGIYVSRVDSFGLADKKGIKPGDQIIEVNGVPFENILHHHAVDILRNQMPLILIVRYTGRYPVYKELCAEYTWSDGQFPLPTIHLPYSDVDVYSMVEERFTDTCIDGSEGSLKHLPSESGIDLNSHHSQTTINYQHSKHSQGDLDASPKPADVVYRRNQHWDGTQSDDELETSKRMELWENGLNRNNINPGYKHGSDSSLNRMREDDMGDDIQIYRDQYSGRTSNEFSEQREFRNNEKTLSNGVKSDFFNLHTDANSLCEEQTMSFFISEKPDEDRKSELQTRYIEDFQQRKLNATGRREDRDSDFEALETDVKVIEGTRSPSFSEQYGKQDMSGVQEMEYAMNETRYTQFRASKLQSDSGLVTNSFGNPVGTIALESQGSYEENYQGEGKLVASLYSSDLQGQIRNLEIRKTDLGIRELDSLVETPTVVAEEKREVSSSVAVEGKSTTRKKKWKSVKDRFMGSLRRSTVPTNRNSGYVDKENMTVLEESGRRCLEEDEYYAVMRHIQNYHNNHDLDWLIEVLLAILDKPEKILLFKEIRTVIFESDKIRYDQKVNRYQDDAYETMYTKVHLPLKTTKDQKSKKSLMTTEKGEGDHFHIKTIEQSDRERRRQAEVLDVMDVIDKKRSSSHKKSVAKPKKEFSHDTATMKDYMFGEREVIISEKPPDIPQTTGKEIVAYISKNKKFLGMRVSGGADFEEQTEVMIDWVEPGGAAADEGNIQPGMVILAVDDQDLRLATHREAVGTIKKSFSNKRDVSMKLVLRNPNYL